MMGGPCVKAATTQHERFICVASGVTTVRATDLGCLTLHTTLIGFAKSYSATITNEVVEPLHLSSLDYCPQNSDMFFIRDPFSCVHHVDFYSTDGAPGMFMHVRCAPPHQAASNYVSSQ